MRAPVIPHVSDETTARALSAVEDTLGDLIRSPLVDAKVIGPLAIGTADTRVHHGLGRRPRGVLIIKSPTDVRIFDGAAPEANDPEHYMTLRLSSAETVTIVVF